MSHSEPKLLFAIAGIKAFHIQDGSEESLTPSGAQTLSLLMVPTSSPFAIPSSVHSQSEVPEEDFYLHLHLPPELDLPLPATTQIYHQPPSSYLIPRWDLGPDSGAFTRIEFPSQGKASQEDIDTFETILAQCTAFLERARAPQSSRYPEEKGNKGALPKYNPADYGPHEGYVVGSASSNYGGQIVLVDEEDGSVVGELGEGFFVVEDSEMKAGSKDPVMITLPQDGTQSIAVEPATPEYLEMAMHPAYRNSSIVSTAAAASRFIVTATSLITSTLQAQATTFTQTTKPNSKPLTFTPTTHARIRKINTLTQGAAGLSAKTVGQVSKYAQNFGASMTRRGESQKPVKGIDANGQPVDNYKPGLLNKTMMAFSTVMDGVDQAGRSLLASTSTAASTVVGHKYGAEAGEMTRHISGGFKNVGLVYIDATGVSRRAIIKSVAKGMVIGKVKGGGDLVVGSDANAIITNLPTTRKEKEQPAQGIYASNEPSMSGARDGAPAVGSGRSANALPAYTPRVGDSAEGQWVPDAKYE